MKTAAILLVLLVLSTTVLAHNPRAETDDWGNFNSPYVIEDGTISYAFFATLNGDDVDIFRFDFAEAESLLRLKLFVPVCGEDYADFYPQVLILGPASEGAYEQINPLLVEALPDDFDFSTLSVEATPEPEVESRLGTLPDGLALVERYITQPEGDERTSSFEYHTMRTYYASPEIDLTLDATGSYYLVVFDPSSTSDSAERDYLLSAGYKEEFFPPLESEPQGVSMSYRDVWPSRSSC